MGSSKDAVSVLGEPYCRKVLYDIASRMARALPTGLKRNHEMHKNHEKKGGSQVGYIISISCGSYILSFAALRLE